PYPFPFLPFNSHPPHPTLPSFPTRRSSDLDASRQQQMVDDFERVISVQREVLEAVHRGCVGVGKEGRQVQVDLRGARVELDLPADRKSTRLNSSHVSISYAVFCLKKKIRII